MWMWQESFHRESWPEEILVGKRSGTWSGADVKTLDAAQWTEEQKQKLGFALFTAAGSYLISPLCTTSVLFCFKWRKKTIPGVTWELRTEPGAATRQQNHRDDVPVTTVKSAVMTSPESAVRSPSEDISVTQGSSFISLWCVQLLLSHLKNKHKELIITEGQNQKAETSCVVWPAASFQLWRRR